jgi:hypothetical protein
MMKGHNGGPPIRDAGWYATHRDMLNHPIVGIGKPVKPADPNRGSLSRFEAWHWLIANAAYRAQPINNLGMRMTLQPGQVMGARAYLAREWNWSEMTVRWFLKVLLDEHMITLATDKIRNQQRTNTANIITLCNYLKYQLGEDEQQPAEQPANNQPTTSQQPQSNKETNIQIEDRSAFVRASDPKSFWDGSHGVVLENGSLSVVNGTAYGLAQEFPGLDLQAVCDLAAPDVLALQSPSLDVVLDTIRKVAKTVDAKTKKPKSAKSDPRGTRLPDDWRLPKSWGEWALEHFVITPQQVRSEAEGFRDYWLAKAGASARKMDWQRTFQNWIRESRKKYPIKKHDADIAPDLLAAKPDKPTVADYYANWRDEHEIP